MGCHLKVASIQIVFRKKLCVILMNPYKNLGRFYRVPFKSLLRVQIKRVNNLQSNAPSTEQEQKGPGAALLVIFSPKHWHSEQ